MEHAERGSYLCDSTKKKIFKCFQKINVGLYLNIYSPFFFQTWYDEMQCVASTSCFVKVHAEFSLHDWCQERELYKCVFI